jgi:transcriptional regulator with XRE-family HTH domain
MEIGDRLKTLRLQRGMTLADLSRAAGVSTSMLSRVERNDSAPTVTTLERIAAALGLDVAALFAGAAGAEVTDAAAPAAVAVVRHDQRKRVILPWGADYEMLSPDLQRRIEFIHINYPVGGGSGDLYSHDGEECGVVLQGRFRGVVGDQEFILEPGDSISYASSVPHRWENAGDVEAKAIWAITPPSFLTGKLTSE